MDKNVLKKDLKDLNTKDKTILASIIVIFILIITVCIVLIINKNDKDIKNKIENNKNNYKEVWKTSEVVEFNSDKDAKYYEYCVSITKDNKDCLWSRTEDTSLTIEANGHKYVYFKLIDSNEKVIKEDMKEVYVDNSNPIINNVEQLDEEKLTIRVDAVDNVSSIEKYFFSLDGKEYTEGTKTYVLNDLDKTKEYTLYVKVVDKAGNTTIDSYKIGATTGKSETPKVKATTCPEGYTYREDTNYCFKDVPMSSDECTKQGGMLYTSQEGVDTCTLTVEPISE